MLTRRIITLTVAAGLLLASVAGGGVADARTRSPYPYPDTPAGKIGVPWQCGLPFGRGEAPCNRWRSYAATFDDINASALRERTVTAVLAQSGNATLARRAGAASVRGSAECRRVIPRQVQHMLNDEYRRNQWGTALSQVFRIPAGRHANMVFPAAEVVAARAIHVGGLMFTRGQATAVLGSLAGRCI